MNIRDFLAAADVAIDVRAAGVDFLCSGTF
jgi:hypothetical protein